MTGLILKDLRVLRPWWWLIVPGHLLFAANGVLSPETFFGMNVALALAFTLGLLILEWRQDADRFVASLPVTRGDMVRARYAGALGAAVVATVAYAAYGSLLLGFATERLLQRWPGPRGWESTQGLAVFFLTVWLLTVAYLPFYFRSGLAKGTWLFLGSVGAGAVAVAALLRWRGLSSSVGEGASGFTVLVAMAAGALLGWASLRLSVRFYERRDL